MLDDVVAVLAADAGDALGEELRAEAIGLQEGALGELVAAEALGEAEVVFDPGAGAGLAADGIGFDDEGAQAFGGAVDAGSEAGGTGADDDDVVELLLGLGAAGRCLVASSMVVGWTSGGAVAEEDDGELGVVEALLFEQVDGFGHAVPGSSHLYSMRLRERKSRTAWSAGDQRSADDADALVGRLVALLPGFEQVVEDGVELFFGRVPGLVEVVVDLGGVDGADGGFGVGVGGEQDALGLGVDGDGLLEEVDAGHAGHALVGEEEGDGLLALLKLAADVERGLPEAARTMR